MSPEIEAENRNLRETLAEARASLAELGRKMRRVLQEDGLLAETPLEVSTVMEKRGFIRRVPHQARAIELTIAPELVPPLDRPFKF
jgi:hypothetical protein